MPDLQTRGVLLHVSDDGLDIQITDRLRGCAWRLDRRTRVVLADRAERTTGLPPGSAVLHGERIRCEHVVGDRTIRYELEAHDDHVELTLDADAMDLGEIALPGHFEPVDGQATVVVPSYQGLLLRGGRGDFEQKCEHGGHGNFSLAMAGTLGANAGLLVTHDAHASWVATFGVRGDSPYVFFSQSRCPVDGFANATVRLWPCDPSIAAIARRYRDVLKSRGELVMWDQKMQSKPSLRGLFGSLMCFNGYMHDDIDYVANTKALLDYGFESVFLYPVRMCHYSLNFQMGKMDPIWLSDDVLSRLHALGGVRIAPWAWVFEGIDDGSERMRSIFRHDQKGPWANWRMDENRWFMVCSSCQADYTRGRLAGDMAAMDWLHFDVNATFPPSVCMSSQHALHANRPMGRAADVVHTRKLLSPATVGDRIVSSEGFNDAFAPVYDIGSTKMMPAENADSAAVPIPLTMLVLHDSCLHDWWELHNYNANSTAPIGPSWRGGLGRVGAGMPRLKAALDALYGCPPNVFAFGAQYGWVNKGLGETFAYRIRVADPAVQEALAAALPVSRLHKRVGPLAMTDFALLCEDGRVQKTTFSDGTEVVANIGSVAREVEGRLMPGESWHARGPGFELASDGIQK